MTLDESLFSRKNKMTVFYVVVAGFAVGALVMRYFLDEFEPTFTKMHALVSAGLISAVMFVGFQMEEALEIARDYKTTVAEIEER